VSVLVHPMTLALPAEPHEKPVEFRRILFPPSCGGTSRSARLIGFSGQSRIFPLVLFRFPVSPFLSLYALLSSLGCLIDRSDLHVIPVGVKGGRFLSLDKS